MQSEHFNITTDAAKSLLHVTMRGHWTTNTVDDNKQLVVIVVAGMLSAGCRRGNLLALVDARDLNAQSQDVVAEFKASMTATGWCPAVLLRCFQARCSNGRWNALPSLISASS